MQTLDLFVSLYGAEAGNLARNVMGMGEAFMGGRRRPDRGLRFDH